MSTTKPKSSLSVSSDDDGSIGSDECANIDMSSHSSLSSGDDADEKAKIPDEMLASLSLSSLPEPLEHFLKLAQEQPLYDALHKFRKHKRQSLRKHRMETPSAFAAVLQDCRLETPSASAAVNDAEKIRVEFTKTIEKVGSDEQKKHWSSLSPELCDEFLCHVFLPKELGGIFPSADDD